MCREEGPATAKQPTGKAWHSQSAEKVLAQLASTSEGLSALEAPQRLATDGPNELKEDTRISPVQIFLGRFNSLIIWILVAASVISGAPGEVVDAIAIIAIVVLDDAPGGFREQAAALVSGGSTSTLPCSQDQAIFDRYVEEPRSVSLPGLWVRSPPGPVPCGRAEVSCRRGDNL